MGTFTTFAIYKIIYTGSNQDQDQDDADDENVKEAPRPGRAKSEVVALKSEPPLFFLLTWDRRRLRGRRSRTTKNGSQLIICTFFPRRISSCFCYTDWFPFSQSKIRSRGRTFHSPPSPVESLPPPSSHLIDNVCIFGESLRLS